jgi:hypothetical protein
MALIECAECKAQISSLATACPKCGCPVLGRAAGTQVAEPVMTGRPPLQMRPIGLGFGVMLLGVGVWMFASVNLSQTGRILAGALTIAGVVQLLTGSFKRAKSPTL